MATSGQFDPDRTDIDSAPTPTTGRSSPRPPRHGGEVEDCTQEMYQASVAAAMAALHKTRALSMTSATSGGGVVGGAAGTTGTSGTTGISRADISGPQQLLASADPADHGGGDVVGGGGPLAPLRSDRSSGSCESPRSPGA